jgi:hypothetical protein
MMIGVLVVLFCAGKNIMVMEPSNQFKCVLLNYRTYM